MRFDIQPSEEMRNEQNIIRIHSDMREKLGIILGQFLQLRGIEELILQVEVSLNADTAQISPENFIKLETSELKFKILEVTLGCDPEFYVIYENHIISAATYLPFAGQIGCDGTLGELRPRYAKHEHQLVSNIQQLIPQIPYRMKRSRWATELPKDGRDFDLQAHSYYAQMCAGFHVHLGIPSEILNTRKDFNRIAINHLVQCLDWYVSVPLIPLEIAHQRRVDGGQYGRPGDYRLSNLTLEYRVPGAFYLRSPLLTEGLLGLSLMVTETIVSRLKIISKNFVNLNKLTKSDMQEVMPIPTPKQIQQVLLDADIKYAEKQLDKIQTQLSKLPTYSQHQTSVNRFLKVVETKKRPNANLLQNWKEKQ